MSDQSESNAVLGFVAGAVVIAAVILFFFVGIPGGTPDTSPSDVNISVETPAPAPVPPAN